MSSALPGLLVILLLIALVYTWFRCHTALRAKGYGAALIATVFVVLLFIALAIGGSIPDDRLTGTVPFALWIACALLLAWALPCRTGAVKNGTVVQRGERTAGRRGARHAVVWGWVFAAGGGAMTLFFVWQLIVPTIVPRNEGWRALPAAIAVLLVSQYWFAIARRSKDAPETIPALAGSVLYLRSFDEENRPFAVGPRSALKKYTSQYAAHPVVSRGDPTLRLTLEDYLEEAITARIGPFVGLGNPYDRAAPDGATREYAADEQWQVRFLELAGHAQCIVVSIGGSANLQWELQQIKERGWGQKLCLFTPPIVPGTDDTLLNTLRRTAAARKEALAAAWTQWSEVLAHAGFSCAANPGPGAALTFDERGNSTIITTDASTPAEFIAPVGDWFKENRASGRCIPVTCRACGTPTCAVPGPAAHEGTCYDCRQKDQHARKGFAERHPAIAGVLALVALGLVATFSQQVLKMSSAWVIIPLWLLVLFLPMWLVALWRTRRQKAKS